MSLASEAETFSDPAGHSQGRELKAKNGSNFLPRLACEETKKEEFNEACTSLNLPIQQFGCGCYRNRHLELKSFKF